MIKEKKSKKKTFIIILIAIITILALVFLFFWNTPFIRHIDTDVTALMIRGANTETTEVEIKIKGEYPYGLFGNFANNFSGNLIIDGIAVTQENYTVYIRLGNSKDFRSGKSSDFLIYTDRMANYEMRSLGWIYADKDFKSFVIIPYPEYIDDPAYKGNSVSGDIFGETIIAICYPAKTRGDAVKMVNEIFENFENFHME